MKKQGYFFEDDFGVYLYGFKKKKEKKKRSTCISIILNRIIWMPFQAMGSIIYQQLRTQKRIL